MKHKPPLILMEQMVMLLVFALAAALCLQAFVKSDQLSKRSESRDRALQEAQTAAEVIRYTSGNFERAAELLETEHYTQTDLTTGYDGDWNRVQGSMRYTLNVSLQDSGVPGMGMARIQVKNESTEEELVCIDVAWQKGVSGGAS